jgi:ribonucleoside-diphosphate reductase alpha chain
MKVLSHMYRTAWHVGLKTTYYLRTLGASNIEKATVTIKKSAAPKALSVNSVFAPEPARPEPVDEAKLQCRIDADRNGGECEVCQ